MTIFVDSVPNKFRNKNYYHMLSDNVDNINELHDFANSIGLKKEWFQDNKGDTPHYDISENKKNLAIQRGAKTLTNKKEIVNLIRLWRKKQ